MDTAGQEKMPSELSDAQQSAALNFKVAVEVMGWKPVYVRRDDEGRQMLFATWTYEGKIEDLDFYETEGNRKPCGWSPSTDIADAWTVVERMKGMPFSERQEFGLALTREIGKLLGNPRYSLAWPDALFWMKPDHICLAALEASNASEEPK